MIVKPYSYKIPVPERAPYGALGAGGCMSTSGCSCRYRSSLRTWSGGPGGNLLHGPVSLPGKQSTQELSEIRSYPPG